MNSGPLVVLCVLVASCAAPPGQSVTAPERTPPPSSRPPAAASGSSGAVSVSSAYPPEPAPPPEPPAEPAVVYPFQETLIDPALPRSAAAVRNANLSPAQCRAEVKKRGLPVGPARGPARGVAAPLRLTGPLHGVRFLTPGAKSKYGIIDCRLVLALDDLALLLAMHGVSDVRIDNFYRPRAHLPGSRKPSQHSYGLAADVTELRLAGGVTLDVEEDFQGTRGEPVCGPLSALVEPTPDAISLRNLVCAIAEQGLFHHMLTPNYDEAHRDHLHLDIKRDDKRRSVH